MTERDNYYLLLGLDPAEDDLEVIERRIQEKRREWSKLKVQGNPELKRSAARWLENLDHIQLVLGDPQTRRAEAGEAKKRLQRERKIRLRLLDERIEILSTSGQYDDQDIKVVMRGLANALTADEIEARFRAAGLVRENVAEEAAGNTRQGVDPVVAKNIRANLSHLGLASLYEFLGRKAHNSPAELNRRADEIYTELKRIGKTDGDSSARSELTGLCKRAFADATEKAKYDYTLSVQVMDELKDTLELAGRDRFLTTEKVAVLVRQAVARGVTPDNAKVYIEAHAAKRKWGVQREEGNKPVADARYCGYCGTVATSEQATACVQCGEPLAPPCPRCATPVPSSVRICPSCGCDTGDAPLVRAMMREGRRLTAAGDSSGARRRFNQALTIWPDWDEAKNELRAIDDRDRQLTEQLKAIDERIAQRRLGEARGMLEQAVRRYGRTPFEGREREVRERIARADAHVATGQRLQASGRQAEALEQFTRALAEQADSETARRALEGCPPPPPATLKTEAVATGFRLTWSAPGVSEAEYQIIRRAGTPPTAPEEGETLKVLRGSHFVDTEAPIGTPCFYAVYTRRGPVPSRTPASAGPLLRTAEVTELTAIPGDGQIALSWRRPPGCIAVEVRSRIVTSTGIGGDQRTLPVTGDSCVDSEAGNGQPREYRVSALFDDPVHPGRRLSTPGLRCTATAHPPPPAVRDLRAVRHRQEISLSWSPPERGVVQIRASATPAPYPPGHLLDLHVLDRLGRPIPTRSAGHAQATLVHSTTHLVPVTVDGGAAVVGDPVVVTSLDPVSGVVSHTQGRSVVLTWQWPPAADRVIVAFRHDAFPAAADDPLAASVPCTREEYTRLGCWELHHAEEHPHYFALFVAASNEGPYSAGTQHLESMGIRQEVRYRVVIKRRLLLSGVTDVALELRGPTELQLPGMLLIAKPHTLPTAPGDGVAVNEIEKLTLHGGSARFAVPRQHWNHDTYARLFFRRDEDARTIQLLHGKAHEMRLG